MIPDAWSAVFDNATTALPYAPWHAVLFAAVLVATALALRSVSVDKAAAPTAAAATEVEPTTS